MCGRGVSRICTQVLGLRTMHAVVSSTNCSRSCHRNQDARQSALFFAKYSWHLRPTSSDIKSWNGSCEAGEGRFKRNVRIDDEHTAARGLKFLDEEVCEIVLSTTEDLDRLSCHVI